MRLKPLKIGYFADGIWSHNAFIKITNSDKFEIKFVVPRFDSEDEVLENLAKKRNIPLIKSPNINSKAFLDEISPFKCDIFVSMSFDQIFKEPLISLPRLKSINCHAGKLPFYRGRNVINWALINGESSFGITVHFIDSGIDTGDIILQRDFAINDDYTSVLAKAHEECANVLFDALVALQKGLVQPKPQNLAHSVGFYCPKRDFTDDIVNWHSPTLEILNFIRALNAPNLGAKSLVMRDKKLFDIVIFKAKIIPNAPNYIATPGAVVGVKNGDIVVKTLDNTLLLSEFSCEKPLKIGDRLLSAIDVAKCFLLAKNRKNLMKILNFT